MFGAQNTFGTAAKPMGFGTPITFGTPASTSAPTTGFSFGSNYGTTPQQTNTFGTPNPNQTAPLFGANTFGTPAAPAAAAAATPAFGASTFTLPSAFGATATSSAAPTFAGFGTPTTVATSTPSLFGAQIGKPSIFNTPTSQVPSLFSNQTAPANATPLFGASTQGQAPSLFGTQTTSTPSLFGSTSTPSLFGTSFGAGAAATTTTPSLFGTTGTTGAFGGFKAPATTQVGGGLFGGFSSGTAPGGFGGFGTNTGSGFGFGTNTATTGGLFGGKTPLEQQQLQQQQQITQQQQILASFYAINIFGDERDDILKKWNMLQACWGTGKGFYSPSQPPVEYDPSNPFYRFKAISYVVIPSTDNAEGLVKMVFNKKESEVEAQKPQIINGLNSILGNKPNLTVNVLHVKAMSETECELMITVSEKGITGVNRKIHATDLSAFLNQPTQKQQLQSAGVATIYAYVTPSKAQLEEYLKEAPKGIDPQLWKAAQIDNPKPEKYLPAPILGFGNLKRRRVCGEFETGLHKAFLNKVNGDIMELKKKHAASLALIAEQKQKFLQLQHRVLKILVKQECTRKLGLVLQPEEELLKSRLEMLHTHLNMPTQFRGKLNDLSSSVKVAHTCNETGKNEIYKIDPQAQEEIKQFLKMQQQGITHLISIITNDLKDLKIINDGLQQTLAGKQH